MQSCTCTYSSLASAILHVAGDRDFEPFWTAIAIARATFDYFQVNCGCGSKRNVGWILTINCIGCIDDMLVWADKSDKQTLRDCGTDPIK